MREVNSSSDSAAPFSVNIANAVIGCDGLVTAETLSFADGDRAGMKNGKMPNSDCPKME